ncbi:DUF6785 family protein [Candidatus Poribacteria bacterium]
MMEIQRFREGSRRIVREGVTARAFVVGLFLVAGICIITPYSNHYVRNTYLASNHLPIGPLFILIFLVLLNAFMKRLSPRLSLSSGELAVIWCMMIVAASIPSKAFAEYLLPALVGSYYFATPENEWAELFHQYLPDWLTPQNSYAARSFYEGSPSGGVPWGYWITPLLVWTLFALSLYGVMFCLSIILRKQWVEHERLTFPLVQLPAEIIGKTSDKSLFPTFFRDQLMWIGFAVAGLLQLFNGLHFYFPSVPAVPTNFSLDPFLTDKPFSAIRPLPLQIHPSVIGITYLLTVQVSLSLWFFFLLYKFQCLLFSILGIPMPSSPGELGFTRSFASHQEIGAFIAVIVIIIWRSRRHLRAIIERTFSTAGIRNSATDDSNEPLPYRWAFLGLIFMLVFQVMLSRFMGISLWVAASITLFSAVTWVIFTWQMASSGVLILHPTFRPIMALRTVFGDRAIGPRSLTINIIQARAFRTDLTQLTMPHMMNSLKISDEPRLHRRPLFIAMVAAIVIALPISSYSFLSLSYKTGGNTLGLSWLGEKGFRVLNSQLIHPTDPNYRDLSFIFTGAAGTLLVILMYQRFLWWPLHPIGCTTGSSWGVQMFLFSIFFGWLFKYIILKYGGARASNRARVFFLGLILGEYSVGAVWIIVGLFCGRGYRILTA